MILVSRRQQFLARKFRRGSQVVTGCFTGAGCQVGRRSVKVRLVSGGFLQNSGLNLREPLTGKPSPCGPRNGGARLQKRLAVEMAAGRPPGREFLSCIHAGNA
jgi:hypothetical protein